MKMSITVGKVGLTGQRQRSKVKVCIFGKKIRKCCFSALLSNRSRW